MLWFTLFILGFTSISTLLFTRALKEGNPTVKSYDLLLLDDQAHYFHAPDHKSLEEPFL